MSENVTLHRPGMDGETGRCLTCDSRYCGLVCDAREGYVYVPGMGWQHPDHARRLEADHGRTVHWDEVWTDADGGHVVGH